MKIVPEITTAPCASITTGVFREFSPNVSVLPGWILTVV
jgi:hypothetical protein